LKNAKILGVAFSCNTKLFKIFETNLKFLEIGKTNIKLVNQKAKKKLEISCCSKKLSTFSEFLNVHKKVERNLIKNATKLCS
jgi:hypothetical protein